MSARHTPCLVAAEAKKGDRVKCLHGTGTGFLRRGREYVLSEVTPSGYVFVEGSGNCYHPCRFAAITKATGQQGGDK
ncbi:hypothetical protein D9M73_116560 [compost metagenome]